MTILALALTLMLPAPPARAAVQHVEKSYYDLHLGCWAATADFFLSVSPFHCRDGLGRKYLGVAVGGGIGGLFTLSRFHMVAHLEVGRRLPGQYTGPSVTGALGAGLGVAYFTRNPEASWWPDLRAEEYIYLLGVHLGAAADFTVNTVYIQQR